MHESTVDVENSNLLDLLSALFAACPDDPITLEAGAAADPATALTAEVSTAEEIAAFVESAGGEPVYVRPVAGGRVAFLHVVSEGVHDSGEWEDHTLRPTAVLYREDGMMLTLHALDAPAEPTEETARLISAMGGEPDDLIPLPGSNWQLVHLDPEAFHTLGELAAVYDDSQTALATVTTGDHGTLNDARILRPIDLSNPVYAAEIIVSTGWNKEALKWARNSMPLWRFLDLVTKHREGEKNALAYVGGELVGLRRLKKAMKRIFVLSLDIDDGTPGGRIDAEALKLGCTFVRYTSPSHGKTRTAVVKDRLIAFADKADLDLADPETVRRFAREELKLEQTIAASVQYAGDDHQPEGLMALLDHDPMPRHRLVFPLAEPFEVTEVARTHAAGMAKWTALVKRLGKRLNLRIDNSATDPSRLFNLPRHQPGQQFDATIAGGAVLDWRTLDQDEPADAFEAALEAEVGKGSGKSKSTTKEGQALGRWSIKAARGFQIVDVVRDHAPEKIRTNGSIKIDLLCPFDEEHSNPGDPDDKGCFAVNAGDGPSEIFTIKCAHDACQERTNLDHLGKMIKDGWFAVEVLEDQNYNALSDDDQSAAEAERAVVERRDQARAGYKDATAKLTLESSDEEVGAVARMINEADLSTLERTRAKEALAKKTGLGKRDAETLLKAAEQAMREEAEAAEGGAPDATYTLPAHAGRVTTVRYAGRPYYARPGGEVLCSRFAIIGAARYPDRDDLRDLEIILENEVGGADRVRLAADDIPRRIDLIAKLRGRSMGFASEDGERFVHRLLMNEQPRPRVLYDNPGWRDGTYVAASGAVMLGDPETVGLSEAGLGPNSAPPTAGTLEGWMEGARAICEQDRSMSLKAGLMTGFMGPVLALSDNPSVTVIYTGPPGTGKTRRQEVGVAVSGAWKAGLGQLRSAKTTDNGLELPLKRASGGILALDELKGMPAEKVQDLIFMIYGGAGKSRMRADVTEGRLNRWDGCVVTMSTEVGVAQQLRQSSALRAGGLSARMIEVPVDDDEQIDDATFAKVLKARDNYGHAIRPFIETLGRLGYVDDPKKLRKEAETVVERLALTHHNLRRQAYAVAYLEVAGNIAKKAGLLPEETDVSGLVDYLWRRYGESEIGDIDLMGRAISNVVDYLIAHRGVTVICPALGEDAHRPIEAWRMPADPTKLSADAEWVYVIPTAKLSDMAAGGAPGFANDAALRKALVERGYAVKSPRKDKSANVWRGYVGVGPGNYVVLRAEMVEDVPAEVDAP